MGAWDSTRSFYRRPVLGGEAPRRCSFPLPQVVIKQEPQGPNCPCTRARSLRTDVKCAAHLCWHK